MSSLSQVVGAEQVVVGISDCKISRNQEATLVTYALGSCIAVAAHDPVAGVAGLLHIMLPEASADPQRAQENAHVFADSGVAKLLSDLTRLGGSQRRMVVRLAGGAQMMDDKGLFNIGKRNHTAVRKALWRAGILVKSEAVGGQNSRTVRLEVGTGRLWVKEGGRAEWEMQ